VIIKNHKIGQQLTNLIPIGNGCIVK